MYIDFTVTDRHHITTRFSNCDKLEKGTINKRIVNASTILLISVTRHLKIELQLFHTKTNKTAEIL
jgi:hypothetical protein